MILFVLRTLSILSLIGALASPSAAYALSQDEIQEFIDDAIAAGGGEVVLPPGRHSLKQSLLIKATQNIRIVGLDAEETFLEPEKTVDQPFPLLQIEGHEGKVVVAKLTFTTHHAAANFSTAPMVQVVGSPKALDKPGTILIERCFFQNHQGTGIVVKDAVGVQLTASTFMDLGGQAILAVGRTRDLTIQHNHITRCANPALILGPETQSAKIQGNELGQLNMKIEGVGHTVLEGVANP